MKRLVAPALLLLAACGTPQEQCINRETRELRTVEKLIAETQANLDRGYALERVTVFEDEWTWCESEIDSDGRRDPPYFCLKRRPVTEERPKAIDPQEEARKLAGLQEKRAALARAAEPAIAACRATYPE